MGAKKGKKSSRIAAPKPKQSPPAELKSELCLLLEQLRENIDATSPPVAAYSTDELIRLIRKPDTITSFANEISSLQELDAELRSTLNELIGSLSMFRDELPSINRVDMYNRSWQSLHVAADMISNMENYAENTDSAVAAMELPVLYGMHGDSPSTPQLEIVYGDNADLLANLCNDMTVFSNTMIAKVFMHLLRTLATDFNAVLKTINNFADLLQLVRVTKTSLDALRPMVTPATMLENNDEDDEDEDE